MGKSWCRPKNIQITQETATKNQEIARDGQITDRFTKAIAQLGEQGPEKLAVRLGGIYALARIAKDLKDDHWPVMEVLTAYVRETAPSPWMPPKDAQPLKGDQSPGEELPTTQELQFPKPAADIQAILTVLGRRTHTYGSGEQQRLNLANTDLRGAILTKAQLQGADLQRANLEGADLEGADLRGTLLGGANQEGAENLTVIKQLGSVKTLYGAHVDPPLPEHIRQQYPQLLEEPDSTGFGIWQRFRGKWGTGETGQKPEQRWPKCC